MRDELIRLFEQNLVEVQEDHPGKTFNGYLNIAYERTMDDLQNRVGQIVEIRKSLHQEAICQFTDPSLNALMGRD